MARQDQGVADPGSPASRHSPDRKSPFLGFPKSAVAHRSHEAAILLRGVSGAGGSEPVAIERNPIRIDVGAREQIVQPSAERNMGFREPCALMAARDWIETGMVDEKQRQLVRGRMPAHRKQEVFLERVHAADAYDDRRRAGARNRKK